jgi:hypothetical protein
MGSRFASTMVVRPAASSVFSHPANLQSMKLAFYTPKYQPQSTGIIEQVIEKVEPVSESSVTDMIMTSVLRKRRLKMKKHKLRKRRKAQRALRIKIGK